LRFAAPPYFVFRLKICVLPKTIATTPAPNATMTEVAKVRPLKRGGGTAWEFDGEDGHAACTDGFPDTQRVVVMISVLVTTVGFVTV
jgi:hypothetical protein